MNTWHSIKRIVHALAMAALTIFGFACSGSSPAGVKAPPGIAAVQLVADSAILFDGHKVAGRSFVARVVDSTGAVVTDATITVSASSGWTVKGDTIIAPTTEALGTVRVTASRADPSTATSGPVTIGSVLNLDTLGLAGSPVTCRVSGANVSNDSVGTVDSLQLTDPRVDSVTYASNPDTAAILVILNNNLAGYLNVSSDVLVFGTGGIVSVAHYRIGQTIIPLVSQVPDTVTFGVISGTVVGAAPSPRAGLVPTYKLPGAALCNPSSGFVTTDTLTLTATK